MTTDEVKSFLLMKLPAELRVRIYNSLLIQNRPITPVNNESCKTYNNHVRQCPIGSRVIQIKQISGFAHKVIVCTDVFSGEENTIWLPYSVLPILLVSRTVFQEATSFFYRLNYFQFDTGLRMALLRDWLVKIGGRREHVEELSFKFASQYINETMQMLPMIPSLKRLQIFLNILSAGNWHKPAKPGVHSEAGLRNV